MKLGEHCQALLFTIQKRLQGQGREEVEASRLDLEKYVAIHCFVLMLTAVDMQHSSSDL